MLPRTLVLAVAATLLYRSSEGELIIDGRTYRFPLPAFSIRIALAPGTASYLSVGNPNIHALLERHAADYGWQYIEQMGAGHILASPDQYLTVTTRRWTSAFTLVRYDLVRPPANE